MEQFSLFEVVNNNYFYIDKYVYMKDIKSGLSYSDKLLLKCINHQVIIYKNASFGNK